MHQFQLPSQPPGLLKRLNQNSDEQNEVMAVLISEIYDPLKIPMCFVSLVATPKDLERYRSVKPGLELSFLALVRRAPILSAIRADLGTFTNAFS